MISEREWTLMEQTFEHTGYYERVHVVQDEAVQPWMCHDARMSELPPRILKMIFSLHKRIEKLQDELEMVKEQNEYCKVR